MLSSFFQLTPAHAILIHFPLALIPAALAADALGRWKGSTSLSHAGWWAIALCTLVAPFTAVSGWLWMRQMADMDHPELAYHQWLGTALPVAVLLLAVWRFRLHRAQLHASKPYLAALLVAFGAVTVQGHLGGLMSFGGEPAAATSPMPPPGGDGHQHHHSEGTAPATTRPDDAGWSNSIKVKEHHHE